ncbi:MAG TPA: hypothetical protein VIY70_14415 [Acidimicrobiia bacterium]
MGYEVVESVDLRDRPGAPIEERVTGSFRSEDDAIATARSMRSQFMATGRLDYAWWVVRQEGATLARWIADSQSEKEFVLDLRTGSLVER